MWLYGRSEYRDNWENMASVRLESMVQFVIEGKLLKPLDNSSLEEESDERLRRRSFASAWARRR